MPKPNPDALRSELFSVRRRHNALIVVAITPDEVAFSADPSLSVRDAENTIQTEMPLILTHIAAQRAKNGGRS